MKTIATRVEAKNRIPNPHLLWVSLALVPIWFAGISESMAQTQTGQAPTKELKAAELLSDFWEVITMQGVRVGFGNTRSVAIRENGRDLVKTDSVMNMKVKRLGKSITMKVNLQSVEGRDGQLVRMKTEMLMGPTPMTTTGRVKGDELELEINTLGKSTTTTLPWSEKYRGIFAMERSLKEKPMKPGERRTFKALAPIFNQIAEIEVTADDYEETELLDGKRRLLKINSVAKLGIIDLTSEVWVDEDGQPLKTFEPMMKQGTYRTSRQIALQDVEAFEPDLIVSTLIQVKGLSDIDNIETVRYRVTLDSDEPAEVFPNSQAQSVQKTVDQQALISVQRIDLNRHKPAGESDAKPTDDDRTSNNMIQSDDPTVVKLARQVVPDEKDSRRVAIALEKHVNDLITEKDFTTGLATAADVAASRQGDCTEHAVLLTALARARGIPARVVMGLVYVDRLKSFGYHMWTEVWVDGAWLPLDATLAQSGTGVGHIKLADSNLNGVDVTVAFLPVVKVMGRLEIEVDKIQRARD